MKKSPVRIVNFCIVLFLTAVAIPVQAQTTVFTYQGKLTDGGNSANGQYDFNFKLFTAVSGGTQVGSDVSVNDVQVTAGIFTVYLDFGAPVFTSNAGNALEISVRPGTSSGSYQPLLPRQLLTSSPYAVQTLRAVSATEADNANNLGGVAADQFVQTNDTRLSDARNPLPFSGNYIQNNPASPQPSSGFNISGNGFIAGNVGIGTANPLGKLDVKGTLVLDRGGNSSIFTGTANAEQNRYADFLNSPLFPTASGIKAGGILVSDDFGYANPGKTDLIVKGNVGIGTASPIHKLDVFGSLRAVRGSSNDMVVETTGGQGSWARLWMITPGRGWIMGTDNGGNGNRFYLHDSTADQTRMSIHPGGGVSFPTGDMSIGGHALQSRDKGGWIKAMVFVSASGTIIRCYNGITGASTGNCGFTAAVGFGYYLIDFGFRVSDRFFSVALRYDGAYRIATITTSEDTVDGSFVTPNQLGVTTIRPDGSAINSHFYVVVY